MEQKITQSNKCLKILVSCFACGPKWGSEVGMGWNWVINLAQFCELSVIAEKSFKNDIEEGLKNLDLKFDPEFHYIDIGDNAMKLFWKQGDWRFYWAYKKWQYNAFKLASSLVEKDHFDIVHQLNMIGYREPGYLWKLALPLVWGPIGGHAQLPWQYFSLLGFGSKIYYGLRNIINDFQMRFSLRVKAAIKNADILIAATINDQVAISKIHKRESIVMNETGALTFGCELLEKQNEPLKLVWSGIFQGRKALPIILYALARLPDPNLIILEILGDGIERKKWEIIARKIGILHLCHFHGRVEHGAAITIMKYSDIFVFSSLLEGTPHVVLEAIGLGLPVICHDSCGFGAVINESCGIKIQVKTLTESILGFTDAIQKLINDDKLRNRLSMGAFNRAKELTWENRAKQMNDIYNDLLKRK